MQEEKLIEALHLAKSIMDVCGGDAWERECTEDAREKFATLYDELFPQPKVVNCSPSGNYRRAGENMKIKKTRYGYPRPSVAREE